ncbi:hypothetical protein A5662_02235 [Mycobacteriaceae bacterium 1482268.1]|nr:hypothetical protein A5662_02235 [Mycobacteriaceae bacterium 1482268.1]
MRIAFGILAVVWTFALLPDLYELFGANGVISQHPGFSYQWGVFDQWPSDTALLTGWVVLLISSVALTVGWHSRLAAIVVFVLIGSFVRRDPWVFNAGDGVVMIVSLVLALSSCGSALSLDQWRRTGKFWTAQLRAPWPTRLLQIQMTLIYLASVQAKLAGKAWLEGSAVSYAWRSDSTFAQLSPPQWISTNAYLSNFVSWGTILLELAIAILVWNRRLRPWVLLGGVVLHLGITVSLSVGFFSLAMFVLYAAFIPSDAIGRFPDVVRRRYESLRRMPRRSPSRPFVDHSDAEIKAAADGRASSEDQGAHQ